MLQYKMYPAGELAVLRQLLFFSVSVFCSQKYTLKLYLRPKHWSGLCNFYTKVIVLNFCIRKYTILLFTEFELLMLHNNILKISEKNVQAELVENLHPSYLPITKTGLYNSHPLKPHFYIVKLGFTGVYIIFLILLKNIDCGYSLEPPCQGGSNEYQQSFF